MTTPRNLPPSPKLKPWHLDRGAIVYVRQSTPQQVADHQESTARQYALADRAVALGWARERVTTIDDDLGKSGQSIEGRPGFQRLLAEVALDRIGLILGLEMSRLARSCKDWHQLLELCARFRVLLADADGVFDPTDHSDRLLLGLNGMMNEAELHVLKQRMYQGKLNKARRGELVMSVPVGYLKPASGPVTLDPDEQARGVIRLIFDQFDRQGTVHAVLRHLIANGLRLPVRSQAGANRGQLDWRQPGRETVRQILRHPMYAGAYRYGHRPTDSRRQTAGHPKSGRGSGLAAEDCLVFLKDRFPAYISWDQFEANQQRLAANRSRAGSTGAVRDGPALLAGVVRCGRCGKRMYVRYTRTGRPSYVCSTLRSDYGLPVCQSTSAAEVEAWVAGQVLSALQPAALDASLTASAAVEEQRRQLTRHWEQRVERARYEADRAARQYHACEPENRLVARTLEQRWDELLRDVVRLESEFERFNRTQPRPLGEADRDRVRQLAEQVPAVWHAPTTTPADRRQVVRLLIDRVVLTVDPTDDRIAVRVEWAGGAVREQTVRRPVRGYRHQRDWPQLSARLAALHEQGQTPAEIAVAINGAGFRAPKHSADFTAGMVRRLLADLGLRPRVSRSATAVGVLADGEWWLHELARELGVSPHTLHGWRNKKWVHARQVGGRGGPWAVTEFREQLAADGRTYCVGIDSTLKVIAADADLGPVPKPSGIGRPPTRPAKVRAGATSPSVKQWALGRASEFRTVTWREGSKGKMSGRFAAWRVRPAHRLSAGKEPLAACWLLAEWPEGTDAPAKYFFSNLPAKTSLKRLVATAKSRWWVEHSYRELKDELGLDHFEGRSWRGWNHHVVLVLMAYAFLQDVRRRRPQKVAA